jgi:hypothetical protein
MNFFDSDTDLNVFLGRVLVLIDEFSLIKNDKKILTIERLVIYDFFLKYPIVLTKTLDRLNKKVLVDIKEYEINSLNAFYPSYSELYKFENIKYIIQVMYLKGLLTIFKEDDGLFIEVSSIGREVASNLGSAYFSRVREISKGIAPLHASSFSILRDNVNSLLFE